MKYNLNGNPRLFLHPFNDVAPYISHILGYAPGHLCDYHVRGRFLSLVALFEELIEPHSHEILERVLEQRGAFLTDTCD